MALLIVTLAIISEIVTGQPTWTDNGMQFDAHIRMDECCEKIDEISTDIMDLKHKISEDIMDLKQQRMDSKYVIFSYGSGMSWSDARKECQSNGGDLVTINSEVERKRIQDFVDDYQVSLNISYPESQREIYWTSGHNDPIGSDRWIWGNASITILPSLWGEGEPNNYQENDDVEHCVDLSKYIPRNGKNRVLYNDRCRNTYHFICEF